MPERSVGPVNVSWLEGRAPAKVNLRLKILPRRPDGFHPLQTIFCRLDLADRVRVRLRPEPGVWIRVTGSERVPTGDENLAARAAAAAIAHAGGGMGAEVELEKVIPVGAGLGGGSSDAAAVLRLLSQAMEPALAPDAVLRLAEQLGSDVPFFAADVPIAVASGRGEELDASVPSALSPRPMLLLIPDFRISTAEAYRWWDDDHTQAEDVSSLADVESGLSDWNALTTLAENDFEPVIYARKPALATLRQALDATQPEIALLSGSGSSLFAVFGSDERRNDAARALGDEFDSVRRISARGPV